jgi:hypothetical protein
MGTFLQEIRQATSHIEFVIHFLLGMKASIKVLGRRYKYIFFQPGFLQNIVEFRQISES